jgi:hypothetical protein
MRAGPRKLMHRVKSAKGSMRAESACAKGRYKAPQIVYSAALSTKMVVSVLYVRLESGFSPARRRLRRWCKSLYAISPLATMLKPIERDVWVRLTVTRSSKFRMSVCKQIKE